MSQRINETRREYLYGALSEADLESNPLAQFEHWLAQAQQAEVLDFNAMALATADAQGHPTVRTVLLKGFDADGFRWFSDTGSEKGQALDENPRAELLFHWRELDRQVRIRGPVFRLPEGEVDDYFYSRPLTSQIAAATSQQSQPIDDRDTLVQAYDRQQAEVVDRIARPERWGGYALAPTQYEFWQGRAGRLHDRLQFTLDDAGGWRMKRLQP